MTLEAVTAQPIEPEQVGSGRRLAKPSLAVLGAAAAVGAVAIGLRHGAGAGFKTLLGVGAATAGALMVTGCGSSQKPAPAGAPRTPQKPQKEHLLPTAATHQTAGQSIVHTSAKLTDGSGYSHATGWVVAPEYVVTNRHAVDNADEVEMVGVDGVSHKAEKVTKFQHADIAILHVPGLKAEPLSMASRTRQGTDATVIGFPVSGGGFARSAFGELETPRRLSMPLTPGYSGSPVLDDAGRVLGTVFATKRSSALFVSNQDVVKALHSMGVPWSVAESGAAASAGAELVAA